MKTTKAFVLCAGLGTRFKPHTLFYPKPVLPFFNIPQALYSTSALKEFGVDEFYYNSHHLPEVLENNIKAYFKKGFYEKELLDSAGGLSNFKGSLREKEDFWVINGDSFINYKNTEFLEEAHELHTKNNALATLIGTADKKPGLNGLSLNKDSKFLGLSKEDSSLHFIGLYLLNSEVLNHVENKPTKLFQDVLFKPEIKERTYIYKAPETIKWSETGNEKDFIECLKVEAKYLTKEKENSFIYRTHKNWGLTQNLDHKLENFLETKVWGLNDYQTKNPGDFLCLPETCKISKSIDLTNTALTKNLELLANNSFSEKLLVNQSQL